MKKIVLLSLGIFMGVNLIAQSGLSAGTKAPAFTAKDNSGNRIDLQQILKAHTSVVLFFYRGQWCPYCNKQISELQDSLKLLEAKGAYVIAVSPETDSSIKKTIGKTKASFALVHDEGYKIMEAYDVNYVMEEGMANKYKKYGIDLEMNNGNKDYVLPVPATYIIDKTGKITYVHFDKDYKKRASVAEILTNL